MRERRVRVFWLSEQEVVALFNWFNHDIISLPVLDGLPPGYSVEQVCHDWGRRAFGLMVSHPSFDPVPDGELAPLFGHKIAQAVRLRRQPDGAFVPDGADTPSVVSG